MVQDTFELPDASSKTNTFVIVVLVVVLAVFAILLFLYYKPQKTTTTGVPAATADPNIIDPEAVFSAKTYSNDKFFYSFDCPPNSIHTVDVTGGDGITKPFLQETCVEGGNEMNKVRIFVMSVGAKEPTKPDAVFEFIFGEPIKTILTRWLQASSLLSN
jgi:hypothetical protein